VEVVMRTPSILAWLALGLLSGTAAGQTARPAGIVVILSDDAGYADFSIHGSKQFSTPHIDSIGKNGVRFTQGYVTASVCSPTRAGLLTGRYQQRFGHEMNIPPRFSETNGLPVDEVTIADRLRPLGYRTIALGKWHLGYADRFHPLSRGFDDYFGFLQGARSYWPIRGTRLNRLLRDREPIEETFEYLTDELGNQAAAYLEKHHDRPFFLYLAPNAVHTPMHAKAAILDTIEGIQRPRRRRLAAMTASLDAMVGRVLEALRRHGLEENTLLFFLNDNGGATTNGSSNTPLRGHKGTPFEGGIRVPFLVQWPAVLSKGRVCELPVSSLDVLPTAVAAAGGPGAQDQPLDGTDLIPYLTGRRSDRPHEILFWRRGPNWAVREGDWKLLFHPRSGPAPMLFHLAEDPGEKTDLAAAHPDRVKALKARYDAWARELTAPRWRYRPADPPRRPAKRS
jgi:arylsulfatase A-like enzyme